MLFADGEGVLLAGGGDGLGESTSVILAAFEYVGSVVLHGGAGRGPKELWDS